MAWHEPGPQFILGPLRRRLRQAQHDDLFLCRTVPIAVGQLDGLFETRVVVAEFTRALLHDARRLAGVAVGQVDDGIAVIKRLAIRKRGAQIRRALAVEEGQARLPPGLYRRIRGMVLEKIGKQEVVHHGFSG